MKMTNTLEVQSRICVQWTVGLYSSGNCVLTSKAFTFRNRNCYLQYSSSPYSWNSELSCHTSHLFFKSNGDLQSSVKVRVLGSIPSKILHAEVHSISDASQIIWTESITDLRGEVLTIEVIIYEKYQDDKSVQTSSYIDAYVLLDDLSKDFGKLFQEAPDHDVEFLCGDETIKAHKTVLCSRSNVFASMLRSDMKEGETGQVKIQDMESDIFRKFLRFLYTGVLSELTVDTALGFYEAADKYDADTLKKKCADFLMDNASPENACAILLMADRHSDLDFKKNIIEYVIKVGVPTVGKNWNDFCKENSLLATEVLNLYCQHLLQKSKVFEN